MTAPVGLQPLLHDSVIVLSAPSQAWSATTGDIAGPGIAGFYCGDRRILSRASLTVSGAEPEHIATAMSGASAAEFTSLVRGIDDASADPRLRVRRHREVRPDLLRETIVLESTLEAPVSAAVELRLETDLATMPSVKSGEAVGGRGLPPEQTAGGLRWVAGGTRVEVRADGAAATIDGDIGALEWQVTVPAKGSVAVELSVAVTTADAVVTAPSRRSEWSLRVSTADTRLARWLENALPDLEALRMATRSRPDDVFLAAGAPWFFTLFGRDSIWAARMTLPLGTDLALGTLRVLAALQGTKVDPETAEQPGKIMHELRAEPLSIPGEGVLLPPLYYGTVDATALWIGLLQDAWSWGLADAEVEALLPNLEAALAWLRDYGDSDGDGFLEYVDESGRGLANQGWKDSGDSIQWNDGTLATGPIALCEVQAYAYEAAMAGARILDHFGRPGGGEWREWAANLKNAFGEQFWIDDDHGGYPAIALDADKRPVDSLTSNLGHLLGTGILTEEQARIVASRLVSPELNSGFGLRTMATGAAGYWPLSYHGGSVWAHDTAIAVLGLARDGFQDEAAVLIDGLLAAAEGFGYRMPELHSGDPSSATASPIPYPAACRPQAWSAAAAVAVLTASLGLRPDRETASVTSSPLIGASRSRLTAEGIRHSGRAYLVTAGADGPAAVTSIT